MVQQQLMPRDCRPGCVQNPCKTTGVNNNNVVTSLQRGTDESDGPLSCYDHAHVMGASTNAHVHRFAPSLTASLTYSTHSCVGLHVRFAGAEAGDSQLTVANDAP